MGNPIQQNQRFKLPGAFIMRRLHSLMGLGLVIYLIEHLFVNSQSALYFYDQGSHYVAAVNQIHAIPFLKLMEILFIAIPFLFHGLWGIYYAWTAKFNDHRTLGEEPALPQYLRNRAFSWQRITSWFLLIAIAAHVIHMRVTHYPESIEVNGKKEYLVALTEDQKIDSVLHNLSARSIEGGKSAITPSIGAAFFLVVRETFKNPLIALLYSLLVIGATYHAFNGVWTFAITWGITVSRKSQKMMRKATTFLMGVVMFLGLIAIWGIFFEIYG